MKRLQSGVPQGSILGPILFSMFINDITYCCKTVSIHLYADDAQVYFSRPIGLSEDLVFRVNEDLERISSWAKDNNLNLNASKTKAICITYSSQLVKNLPSLTIQGINIKYESVVTSLGFKLNSYLGCKDHINYILSKIYFILRKLWYTADFIPLNVKLKLVRTLIVPLISFGGLLYGNMDCESQKKLQLALNNCARYIFSKRKFEHISEFSIKIMGCSLTNFLNYRNLVFLNQLIYKRQPEYLFRNLCFAKSDRTCNLIVPRYKYLSSSRTFFVSAIKLWNSLPNVVKNERNTARFKLALMEFLQ